jgi:hypothetical protein
MIMIYLMKVILGHLNFRGGNEPEPYSLHYAFSPSHFDKEY